jgi:hypothetical protein
MLVLAQAAGELVAKGFEPKSVVACLSAGDVTLLKFDKKPEPPAGPPELPSGLNGSSLNGMMTTKEKVAA